MSIEIRKELEEIAKNNTVIDDRKTLNTRLLKNIAEVTKRNITVDVCHGTAMVTISDNFSDDAIVLSDEGLDLYEEAKELFESNGELTMEEATYYSFCQYSEVFA